MNDRDELIHACECVQARAAELREESMWLRAEYRRLQRKRLREATEGIRLYVTVRSQRATIKEQLADLNRNSILTAPRPPWRPALK